MSPWSPDFSGLSIWINLTHIGGCSKCIPVAAAKESRSNALAPGWTWTGKVASNWYGITPAKSVYFPRTSQTRRSTIIFRLLSCNFMRFVPRESSVPLDLHCMVWKRLLCDPATHRSVRRIGTSTFYIVLRDDTYHIRICLIWYCTLNNKTSGWEFVDVHSNNP